MYISCKSSHRDVYQHLHWVVAHKETCNFDKPLNNILKVMDGYMHIFCLESIKTHITRKRFSEKTIVAFTNSTVFILDFYI